MADLEEPRIRWRAIYGAVLLWLGLLIVLMWWFMKAYS
jgi:hypothetical protein